MDQQFAPWPVLAPFPDVRRIAVLRGGGLGDLVFALPAVTALAETYPDAEIVLHGTPMHSALLAGRPGPVGAVRVLPAARGVHDGGPEDPTAQHRFFAESGPFDLAVQMHGGGRWSNPFLLRFGARNTVGARTDDAVPLDRWLPFRYYQHETLRWLEVAGLAGAAPRRIGPHLTVTPADRAAADEALKGLPDPLVVLHPGASDPRRRWPARSFARLAGALAGHATVAVVGAEAEGELVEQVRDMAEGRVVAFPGSLSASALVGVLDRARVMMGNDSGPRHLAQAVGTPTVSVFWMGNVINAGPFGRTSSRVHISWTARCPTCGADCTRQDLSRCPHEVSFVDDVTVEDVLHDVLDLLEGGRP